MCRGCGCDMGREIKSDKAVLVGGADTCTPNQVALSVFQVIIYLKERCPRLTCQLWMMVGTGIGIFSNIALPFIIKV